MNVEEASGEEAKRDRKTVLKEERLKEGKKRKTSKSKKDRKNCCRGIIRQWNNRVGNEF